MAIQQAAIELAPGRTLTIETGKLALLAGGAVTVRLGDTVVLCAACSAAPRPEVDFFPLQVEYREKFHASGMMPGGYIKRETRPSEKEILTARMTDRPLRPLFPKGFRDEVQVHVLLLSADRENDPDMLSLVGASSALVLSGIPFNGPLGALRVGRINGQFVPNPTHAEMAQSDLDLVYAGLADQVIMIEGSCAELGEDVLRDAMLFANEIVKKQITAQQELRAAAGKPKYEPRLFLPSVPVAAAVHEFCAGRIESACMIDCRAERSALLSRVHSELKTSVLPRLTGDPEQLAIEVAMAFEEETQGTVRRLILEQGRRADGRGLETVRPLSCEVGLLPRTHGSALFSRGETQVLVIVTLGAQGESQGSDAITGGPTEKTFMLQYNFPHYSVGEVGRVGGPGRREIGHGALGERSLARVMPAEYPYTVRVVSEVMGSNGSTSMGSTCGASLALMDAGVPIRKAVAGISCGMVKDGDRVVLLTDILGSEDHFGDMDFKVAGTADGVTGFQLDLKIAGISIDLLCTAMQRNLTARRQILEAMNACLAQPRPDISQYAPRVSVVKINPEKIGALIGPGGKVIRGLTEEFDVKIDVEDDGTVTIYADAPEKMKKAVAAVESICAEVEIGKVYRGVVKSVKEFGAFVEILPGQEGLLHISELADYRVKRTEDICDVGDAVTVKVIDIDERGRIRLSRKAALAELKE